MALTKASLIDVNGQELILDADGDTSITADTDDKIDFKTAGSDRMTILSDGSVGIGTSSPNQSLHVHGGRVQVTRSSDINEFGFIEQDASGNAMGIFTNGGAIRFGANGTGTEHMRINSTGKVGIGITSFDEGVLHVKSDDTGEVELLTLENSTGTNGKATLTFKTTSTDSTKSAQIFAERINASGHTDLAFRTFDGSTTERMRIDSSGNVLFHRTSTGFNNDGTVIGNSSGSYMYMERSTGTVNSVLYLHRRNGDGQLITFYESNSAEGYIQVSGSSVTLVGFTGAHDSSGTGISSSTPIGTVLSTIDEEHKQNHAKVKVSDSVGDKRVLGVLQEYKDEETDDTGNTSPEHAVVSAVGIGSVRVTGACEGGDLLESNGDGTAKVQDDDIIRSKTIGKVTIGNTNADVKLVSCVLYCG